MKHHQTLKRLGSVALVASLLAMSTAVALPPPTLPPTPSSVTAGAPFQALATAYQQDFEFDDGGYTTGGSAGWEHGMPVSPPTTLPGQGANVWGTNLGGDYQNSACGYLQSEVIDLSSFPSGVTTGVSVARLAYRQWMHVENRYDAGLVLGSADGGATWQVLTPVGGYPDVPLTTARTCLGLDTTGRAFTSPATPAADAWSLAEFDVSGFLGGSLVVRWTFASDSSVVKRGWYVDDVIVQVGAGASATVPLPDPDVGPVPFSPIATTYAEDFEFSDGGWTGTGTWSWGTPTAPPVTTIGSVNAWGAGLMAPYAANECARLTSPAIDIPGQGAAGAQLARLSFKLWRHLENGYDGAHLEASVDGGATWTRLTPAPAYDRALTSSLAAATRTCLGVSTAQTVWSGPASAPRDDEWMDVSVDVTHLMGKSAMFRFTLGSEADLQTRGVFVDDVIVQLGVGLTPTGLNPSRPPVPSALWHVEGTNPSWQYGFPTAGRPSNTPVWATNLAGNYNANECSAIVSEPIDTRAVPGLGRLELTFEHLFRTPHSADGGATWATVSPVGGYSVGGVTAEARDCIYGGSLVSPGWYGTVASDWKPATVVLQSYVGETIKIRYVFGSNAASHDIGWHVRNIAVTRGAGSVPLAATLQMDALLAKADDALRGVLGTGGAESYRVIVTGPEHVGVEELGFATRAEYGEWFDAKAAPFLGRLAERVELAGGRVDTSWAILPGALVQVDLQGLLAIAAMEEVESVTLDREDAVRLIEPIPDDSLDASNTQGRQQLQAEDIWALGYKGAGIKVTVIDTGIDATHEAFRYADGSSRVQSFVNCYSGTCLTVAPFDDNGHGTHVAGTSVGSALYNHPTHGYFQETGVAPEATLTVAKFLDAGGSGTFPGAIAAINWSFLVAQADLTSNSWGASACSSGTHAVMQLVRTTTNGGMLNVFAAGNSGSGSGTIGSPACSESALSVGAIDNNKVIAAFSSRGPCTDTEAGGPSRICPDVVAKGVAVRSAIPRSGATYADPTGYKSWQGTSMATPHIAGAVILAEQMKRAITGTGWDTAARAEEQVFKLTALDLGAAGEDNAYGWGLPQLLNIYALLDSTDSARLVSTFGVSRDTIRQGDTTVLSFGVRNLGGAVVTGNFLATLEDPQGNVATLRATPATLALLDGVSMTHTFVVTGSVEPGTYTFRGSFDYSWTNSTTNEVVTGTIGHEGTFDVKRVFVRAEMAGLDERTTPGDLQLVSYLATNTGNEDAKNVTIEVTVPSAYVFVPGANFDPTDNRTLYSDPAPTRVVEDKNFGRVTLVYNVGDLPQGASFSFTTQLLPTMPGTYNFLSIAKWQDGAGTKAAQGTVLRQTVGAP